MATRFYMQATGTAKVTPTSFDAGWEQTGQAIVRPLVNSRKLAAQTALTDSSAITIPITTTQDICCYQFVSDDVFEPKKFTTDELFSMVIRVLESALTANAFLAYSLKAVSVDGATVLATLSSSLANTGTEYAATAATRIFSAIALTASQVDELFRLVFEVGSHAQGPTAATTYTMRVGSNAASDFALTSALTTDLNPWMELSTNLNALGINNAQHIKADSGMSCSERTR